MEVWGGSQENTGWKSFTHTRDRFCGGGTAPSSGHRKDRRQVCPIFETLPVWQARSCEDLRHSSVSNTWTKPAHVRAFKSTDTGCETVSDVTAGKPKRHGEESWTERNQKEIECGLTSCGANHQEQAAQKKQLQHLDRSGSSRQDSASLFLLSELVPPLPPRRLWRINKKTKSWLSPAASSARLLSLPASWGTGRREERRRQEEAGGGRRTRRSSSF